MAKAGNRKGADAAEPTAAGRKALLRLLRMLVNGACRIVAEDRQSLRLLGPGDHDGRDFSAALVSLAVSRGLVLRTAAGLEAAPAAIAFLRRALVDGDDAFGEQHRDMAQDTVLLDGARQPVRRNRAESPLAPLSRLKDRGGEPFLPVAAFDAGERLLCDFTRAQMQPRVTASWEPRLETGGDRRSGAAADISDSAMAARDRFGRAVAAMGPELAGVAVDVCCFGKGLETVERERQWPARSAKLMLRAALLALARHYAPPPTAGRRRHHWGDGDFRPRM